MFGSLKQSVNASFAERFVVGDTAMFFRPLAARRAYQLTRAEADEIVDGFAAMTDWADQIRGRIMKAVVPAVLLWAFVCILLRRNLGRDMFGDTFYIATAMTLLIAMPVFAYGQFWFAVLRHLRRVGRQLSGRPLIEVPIVDSYRTRNPFQFALRWTALLALCLIVLIGFVLPETHPHLAGELKPWISFDLDALLLPLGILYGLSMLWNWVAARKAAG